MYDFFPGKYHLYLTDECYTILCRKDWSTDDKRTFFPSWGISETKYVKVEVKVILFLSTL